jgi:hypothetical protein
MHPAAVPLERRRPHRPDPARFQVAGFGSVTESRSLGTWMRLSGSGSPSGGLGSGGISDGIAAS